MAKKFENIEDKIKSREKNFYQFLESVLEGELFEFLRRLSLDTHVYIFSGIIRNYFLQNYLVRDVDVIVDSDDSVEKLLLGKDFIVNSFGGYKIELGHKKLDLWRIDNTWGLKKVPKIFDSDLETFIPTTAFFNFSAIIYSLNNREFIYTNDFLKFLSKRTLDYVYPPNLNHQLCVVNTFYYADKYNLGIENRLLKLIRSWHIAGNKDYSNIQLKHFGKVLYSNSEIDERFSRLNSNPKTYVK